MSHRESIDVNDALMELLIMCYACKTSCARKITGKMKCTVYCKLVNFPWSPFQTFKMLSDVIIKC